MTYFPAKNGQYEPKTGLSAKDCVPSTCAMGVDRATVGAVRTNHAVIRAQSSNQAAGMTLAQGVDATLSATGVKGEARYGLSRADVQNLVAGGRALTVCINCAVTRLTKFRTNWYTGRHAVFVNSYYQGTFEVEDPGTTSAGYLTWPADLLFRAAEAYAGKGIDVIVWPDTERVTKTAVQTGKIRAVASRNAKALGKIVLGRKYEVAATVNGGDWQRANGTTAYGWWKVIHGKGYGFVRGEALR